MPPKSDTVRARRLRRGSTLAEHKLWRALRETTRQWKFRRQHPVGPYVVDIAVYSAKLAIEVDGGQHAWQEAADERRTRYLEAHGWRVVRFWNNEVLENIDGVVMHVLRELGTRERGHP